MPTYPHIERYYEDKQRLIDYGGSKNELNIRPALHNCLDAYCREHRERLALVPELPLGSIVPDGTVKDSLRMARGYWEAKDSHDDLDTEIQKKLDRGYPRNNIIFEDSQTAVLMRHGTVAMRADMSQPDNLHRLIRRFLDYELPEIEEFRKARQQFKADLPTVLENLRAVVAEAEAENAGYRSAVSDFLELCRRSIGPAVSEADVQEMLLQHILTQDIFLRVFAEDQFHRENNVALQLDSLAQTFFTGDVRRDATDQLKTYYGAIARAADDIADYAEKQQFLKAIYEDFYQAYNPAAADRLGVVYTPNEVVDFIIRGTDHLLQKHFGRTLADDNVQILDPATGTGTFVTSLIDYLAADRLEYKYRNEIHANEVAILPYYIANLNIEYSYKEKTGKYLEFPNLCFVDTLDNLDWQKQGKADRVVQDRSEVNLGGLSAENWIRVQEQNEKPISVIIGNPPYNDSQSNWYELNPNRQYPGIDQRIRNTYVKEGTAQRTHQYDMYKRFIRWASDRLADDGIIGFISNSAFLDSRQDDGFRKVVAEEFSELWVVDLKGNARTSGERRKREAGNIFEDKIRVGVAIYFLVRKKGSEGFRVFYSTVGDHATASDKKDYIKGKPLPSFEFFEITPDNQNNWLNQSDTDFRTLMPVANRETKLAKTDAEQGAVFGLYSVGISTNRDDWLYALDRGDLSNRVDYFVDTYQADQKRLEYENPDRASISEWVNRTIKWTSELEQHLLRGSSVVFASENIVSSLYRPFTAMACYYAPILTHRTYQMPQIFPFGRGLENSLICFSVSGKAFFVLATDKVANLHLTGDTQCLPLYRHTAQGERVSNITEWGLRQFRERYGDDSISAEDIFAYTYAVLHDPAYREKYAIDLLRDFPRLPFYDDFRLWVGAGQELLDLHIGFESAEPYGLRRVDQGGTPRRVFLRLEKERGAIALDDKTSLIGVPSQAWDYRLGSRSALEWVLDQYKERKPKDPTIAEKFDTYRFADYKERVIDLLQQVCTVSVRTMQIVDAMADLQRDKLPSS